MVKRIKLICSVCETPLQRTLTRTGTGTVFLSTDGKPHQHSGTKWTAVEKEEEFSLL